MATDKVTLSPTITWNGKEAVEGMIEEAFSRPEFRRFHTVYENIKAKEQIAYLRRFSKVTKKDAGCGQGAMGKDLPMYEKFWDPVDAKVWLQFCWKDFLSSLFAWTIKNGYDKQDLDDTYLMEYIMEVLPDSEIEDIWRIVWFGDTDITHDGASPAGTLGDSSDIAYYNLIDGLWKQIFAGVSTAFGGYKVPRYTISENSESTKDDQLTLADGRAKTIFKELIRQSDRRLRARSDKIILCTRELFDNWQDYKAGKVLETSFAREDTDFEQGLYMNTPIYPIDIWSDMIQSDFDNGTTYYLPNRALLTTVENLAVGFDTFEGAAGFNDAYLDKTTELYNIKSLFKIDAKIIEEFMCSVAY